MEVPETLRDPAVREDDAYAKRVSIGIADMIGRRPTMEDAITVQGNLLDAGEVRPPNGFGGGGLFFFFFFVFVLFLYF